MKRIMDAGGLSQFYTGWRGQSPVILLEYTLYEPIDRVKLQKAFHLSGLDRLRMLRLPPDARCSSARTACAGLDDRGGGPASRESQLLNQLMAAQGIHAIVLSGGSDYGLGAANGVMQYTVGEFKNET